MIRINFFGDFACGQHGQGNGIQEIDKQQVPQLSNALQSLIDETDVNVINYEVPCLYNTARLEPRTKSGPNIYQHPDTALWIERHGFNFVSMANNHIMDYGELGLQDSRTSFKQAKIGGAGTWEEAYKPILINVKQEVKIAILCLTHCEFGVLTDIWDKRFTIGTAWINHPIVNETIHKVRCEVDYLFVYCHAGVEYISQPLPEWRDRYREFIDMGCDGVIASHPHVVQGWEIYNGKPIVYSLGNFYFPKKKAMNPEWYKSLCASLMITDSGNIEIKIYPIVFTDDNIRMDNSEETIKNLEHLNTVLADEKVYMQYINQVCLDLLHGYDCQFGVGGYFTFKSPKGMIKYFAKKMLGKNPIPDVHLLNNLRCESHRHAICRALKLKNGIQ